MDIEENTQPIENEEPIEGSPEAYNEPTEGVENDSQEEASVEEAAPMAEETPINTTPEEQAPVEEMEAPVIEESVEIEEPITEEAVDMPDGEVAEDVIAEETPVAENITEEAPQEVEMPQEEIVQEEMPVEEPAVEGEVVDMVPETTEENASEVPAEDAGVPAMADDGVDTAVAAMDAAEVAAMEDNSAEEGMQTASDKIKKLEKDCKKFLAQGIKGASDGLINLLCNYSDHKETVVGINITPHYIRICQMKHMFDKWTVTHLDSACMSEVFTSDDMLANIDDYVEKLKELIKKNNIKTKNVSLSVPMSSSIVKIVTVQKMSDDELSQAATMESFWQNLIQMEANLYEYSISYRIIKRDSDNNTMDLLFVASRLDDINLYAEIVKRAGLNPAIVDVRCFALKNALDLAADSVSDAYPSAFLELGPDESNILILDDKEIYTYQVSLDNIEVSTEEMVDKFKNSNALEMFVNEYSNQVREIIQRHQAEHSSDSVKHIYVVSFLPITNTFIDKMSNLLQEYFISEFNILDHVDVPLKLSSRTQGKENLSAWAVTMGTAVRKMNIFGYLKKEKVSNTNNLLPGADSFLKEERFRVVSRMAQFATSSFIFVIALIMFASLLLSSLSLDGRLEELADVEGIHTKKKTELSKLTGMNKRLRSLDDIRAVLPSNQKPLLHAYKKMNEVIPEGVWLKEVNFTEPSSIEIMGNALGDQQILNFIGMLNEGGQFAKVALKTMNTVNDDKLYAKRDVQIKNFTLIGTVGEAQEEVKDETKQKKKSENSSANKSNAS